MEILLGSGVQKKKNFLVPPSVEKGLEPAPKISDFEEISLISKEQKSKTFLMKHKLTGAIYAIKRIDKNDREIKEEIPSIKRAIDIMYKCNHPNIVKLYTYFEDVYFFNLVLEHVPKGIIYSQSFLDPSKTITKEQAAQIIKQIISSVYYLHSMVPPVIHRNIMPENIFIDWNGGVKLTEFSNSNYLNKEERKTFVESELMFVPPEMINDEEQTESVDIWNIGILLFELLTGRSPFNGKEEDEVEQQISNVRIKWPLDIETNEKDLISKILKRDPKSRLSLKSILEHPFFVEMFGKCDDCLVRYKEEKEPKIFVVSKDVPSDSANCNKEAVIQHVKRQNPRNEKRNFDLLKSLLSSNREEKKDKEISFNIGKAIHGSHNDNIKQPGAGSIFNDNKFFSLAENSGKYVSAKEFIEMKNNINSLLQQFATNYSNLFKPEGTAKSPEQLLRKNSLSKQCADLESENRKLQEELNQKKKSIEGIIATTQETEEQIKQRDLEISQLEEKIKTLQSEKTLDQDLAPYEKRIKEQQEEIQQKITKENELLKEVKLLELQAWSDKLNTPLYSPIEEYDNEIADKKKDINKIKGKINLLLIKAKDTQK